MQPDRKVVSSQLRGILTGNKTKVALWVVSSYIFDVEDGCMVDTILNVSATKEEAQHYIKTSYKATINEDKSTDLLEVYEQEDKELTLCECYYYQRH